MDVAALFGNHNNNNRKMEVQVNYQRVYDKHNSHVTVLIVCLSHNSTACVSVHMTIEWANSGALGQHPSYWKMLSKVWNNTDISKIDLLRPYVVNILQLLPH